MDVRCFSSERYQSPHFVRGRADVGAGAKFLRSRVRAYVKFLHPSAQVGLFSEKIRWSLEEAAPKF
jgi:hypothetical protein